MSLDWYNKFWKSKETLDFSLWFTKEYGLVEEYHPDEKGDYYIRRGFALMGWLAGILHCTLPEFRESK